MQGSDELRARGMVFHLGGISFGVGQHLAGGVDDGHARVRCRCGLPGSLVQRRRRSLFDAGSNHQGLLAQGGLNLTAQHSYPRMTYEYSHGKGASDDDQQRREI